MIKPSSTIAIYSVGLLGGSIGLALKASGFSGTIIGFSSHHSLDIALKIKSIDKGYSYDNLESIITQIDILFLCSPINAIKKTIKRLSNCTLPDGLLITDVGSTKNEIMDAAQTLPAHVSFIGGHPMTGSEKSGPEASDPYLFQNAIYALTPGPRVSAKRASSFSHFLEQYLGSQTLTVNPEVHDSMVASISHIPHLLAVSLVNFAGTMDKENPGTLALAAGGFRDMTRIAAASYPMWKDIFETNRTTIDAQLETLIHIFQDIRDRLKSNALQELFDRAKDIRSQINSGNKGFAHQLHEILLVAPDQVGIIARVSSILAQNQINIKDIEVLKVRENEGGTILIGFDSSETAKKAVIILNNSGFSARERN